MKKTKYFTKHVPWNTPVQGCDELIKEKDKFISKNIERIAKIDSEDLKVEFSGNNHAICILRFTYFEK
jgi:hypothetical protein